MSCPDWPGLVLEWMTMVKKKGDEACCSHIRIYAEGAPTFFWSESCMMQPSYITHAYAAFTPLCKMTSPTTIPSPCRRRSLSYDAPSRRRRRKSEGLRLRSRRSTF
jgi:hypothetical protein